jgi:hypothetical protein
MSPRCIPMNNLSQKLRNGFTTARSPWPVACAVAACTLAASGLFAASGARSPEAADVASAAATETPAPKAIPCSQQAWPYLSGDCLKGSERTVRVLPRESEVTVIAWPDLKPAKELQAEAAKSKIKSASQDAAKTAKTAAAQQQRQRTADRERYRRSAPTNAPVTTESYRAYGYQSADNDHRRGGFGFGW